MHVEASYSEPDAERIFMLVCLFIETLSAHLNEQGQPLA